MESAAPALSSVELEVGRLRRLQREGRHAEALDAAQSLLGELPENRDLWLIAATSHEYIPDARRAAEFDERYALYGRLAKALGPHWADIERLAKVARPTV